MFNIQNNMQKLINKLDTTYISKLEEIIKNKDLSF